MTARYDKSVSNFADRMKAKLIANEHKGDTWLNDEVDWLVKRLYEEVDELALAIKYGANYESVANEGADVGNFAMMVAERYSLLKGTNNG